jgi:prepilin-type N-terminal cleavage/methylation domain-containing protein
MAPGQFPIGAPAAVRRVPPEVLATPMRSIGTRGPSGVVFPLTPALSRGERGKRGQSLDISRRASLAEAPDTALPLPKGEGWGEGKQPVLHSRPCDLTNPSCRRPGHRQLANASAGFTLIEILITIALLAFIILGLYGMFTQVQRAFRQSMSQVDLLEAGRAVTEMIPRELEQITPARFPYPNGVNFFAYVPASTPLTQPLPGSAILRTNLFQDCFLLLRDNQNWVGVGYCVRTNDAAGRLWLPECGANQMGAGSLYRFTATLPVLYNSSAADPRNGLALDPSQLYLDFVSACASGSAASRVISNRICDGVIHFRFRAYDTNGWLITSNLFAATDIRHSTIAPGEIGLYKFCSNAVPASVEMELGIVDQHTWERYNSIPAPAARLAYLQRSDISSRVQLFRQRIQIRNVDPVAYQ